MKYYWIIYLQNDRTLAEDVSDKHPFVFIEELNNLIAGEWYALLNWKEITKEEYNIYNGIVDK